MVAKRKIKNFSDLSYSLISSLRGVRTISSEHCIETPNSAHRMIIPSGNLLPDEGRAHYSVRDEKSEPLNGACSQWRGMRREVNCERMRTDTGRVARNALLRRSQGRAEIAQFVVDLLSFPYGLGDFFAEQTAVTVTQPVYEIFHCRFL